MENRLLVNWNHGEATDCALRLHILLSFEIGTRNALCITHSAMTLPSRPQRWQFGRDLLAPGKWQTGHVCTSLAM